MEQTPEVPVKEPKVRPRIKPEKPAPDTRPLHDPFKKPGVVPDPKPKF